MKRKLTSLLLALAMALTLLPTPAMATTAITKITITISAPVVGRPLATEARTSSNASTEVVKVEWPNKTADGLAKSDIPNPVIFTVKIKAGKDARFSPNKATSATVNGNKAEVERVDDTTVLVRYTFPSKDQRDEEKADKEHAEEVKRRWSKAEADAAYPLGSAFTLLVNENTTDLSSLGPYSRGANISQLFSRKNDKFYNLDGNLVPDGSMPDFVKNSFNWPLNYYRVNRVVYDLYREDDPSLERFPNVTEIWLSPKCDIQGILNNVSRTYANDRTNFNTWNCTIFIPDTLYPNGPTYTDKNAPGCRVMLYSGGDVYAAARLGKAAARDWCTNHSYTYAYTSYDRLYSYATCQSDMRFYYSCTKCGKCEYNPNHTFFSHALTADSMEDGGLHTAHDYDDRIITDEHFLGFNANGDRVYLKCCRICGKDERQVYTEISYDRYVALHGSEGGQDSWRRYQENRKKLWAQGASYYNSAIKATPEKDGLHNSYAIAADKFVWANVSGWARTEVQDAANAGLVDVALLGSNYGQGINRLQFCSIAVKMAEKMTGKAITPAPSGTFSDTDNEYARKASAASITTGAGGGRFNPNGVLTRQEMATFLYRALMYVKANSDTEYTVYESKLGSYTDAGQLASWAKNEMAFMNALGLIGGTSATTLAPTATCTVEQALVVAYRSLDAGGIGWYQCVASPANSMKNYSTSNMCYYTYGDRVWFTSSQGHCVDPYGRAGGVDPRSFYAIKDR